MKGSGGVRKGNGIMALSSVDGLAWQSASVTRPPAPPPHSVLLQPRLQKLARVCVPLRSLSAQRTFHPLELNFFLKILFILFWGWGEQEVIDS